MASAGLNCCSKSASTNVCKDCNCFNEHAKPLLLYSITLSFYHTKGFVRYRGSSGIQFNLDFMLGTSCHMKSYLLCAVCPYIILQISNKFVYENIFKIVIFQYDFFILQAKIKLISDLVFSSRPQSEKIFLFNCLVFGNFKYIF